MKKFILLVVIVSTSLFALQSEDVYKQCVVCHGKHGELIAIKRSPQLSSLGEEELSMRLKKILDGSTSMSKSFFPMHNVKLKKLAPEEADELAKYVVNLKQ